MSKDIFKLYSYFYSSAAWRVRIALNLKKIKYEYIPVNIVSGEQFQQEYTKLNPNKVVPTLFHNNNKLLESTSIIEYLDELKPDIYPLMPKDAFKRAQVRAFSQVINSGIQPLQNLRITNKVINDYKGDKNEWILHWLENGYKTLDGLLDQHQGIYCVGDQVSMADLCLYPQIVGSVRRLKVDLNKYKNIQRIIGLLEQIEAFRQAEPENQPDFPQKQ